MNGEWIEITGLDDTKRRFRWQPDFPVPPESRISYTGFLNFFYGKESEFYRWIELPWWKRVVLSFKG